MSTRTVALVLTSILLAPATAVAQEPDPHSAQPERPTAATHAYTVAPGWTEIESGVEIDHHGAERLLSTPTTLKLGLARSLQLEATGAWLRKSDGGVDSGTSGVVLALKWRLADSLPVLGAFAIQPGLHLPTGTAGPAADATIGSLLLISSHELGGVSLDINLGIFKRLDHSDEAPKTATFWTVSAGLPMNDRLGWVVECYGYPRTTGIAGADAIVSLLTGPTFNLRKWLVVDLGTIMPLVGHQPHALYAGVTWNIGRVWRAGVAPQATLELR